MRIAAELHVQPRPRRACEVGRHQGGAAAVERERRHQHAPVADRHQLRHARLSLLLEHVDRFTPARRRLPPGVRRARHLGTRCLPPRRPLRPREMRDAARPHVLTPRTRDVACGPLCLAVAVLIRLLLACPAGQREQRGGRATRAVSLRSASPSRSLLLVRSSSHVRTSNTSRFGAAGLDAPDSNTPPNRRPHPNGTKSTTATNVRPRHAQPTLPSIRIAQILIDGPGWIRTTARRIMSPLL